MIRPRLDDECSYVIRNCVPRDLQIHIESASQTFEKKMTDLSDISSEKHGVEFSVTGHKLITPGTSTHQFWHLDALPDQSDFLVMIHLSVNKNLHSQRKQKPENTLIETTHFKERTYVPEEGDSCADSQSKDIYRLFNNEDTLVTMHTKSACHRGIVRYYPVVAFTMKKTLINADSPRGHYLDIFVSSWWDLLWDLHRPSNQ